MKRLANKYRHKQAQSNLFKIAFRNLSRHRVKTIITVTAVALGILSYLFMDAFLLGVNTESRRNLVNFEMGAAKIYTKAYWDKKDDFPLYEGFTDYQVIADKLKQSGYMTAPRAAFVGTLLSKEEELPFIFNGVDPASEQQIFLYHKYLEKQPGAHFLNNGTFEILIGVRGAKDLGVKVGDTVRLSTVIDKRDEAGQLRHINQAIDLVIAGIINSIDPIINGYMGFIPLDVLQDDLGLLLEGSITELVIRKAGARVDELPGSFESPQKITEQLGPVLPSSMLVLGWKDLAKDYLSASAMDIAQTIIFLGFFFVIVLMVISNTVLMAVLERTREIGMLRALGMTDRSIVWIFFIETGLIGLLGALIGVLLSLPINSFMVNQGIDYSQMLEATGITNMGYRLVGVFKSAWNYHTMIGSVIGATVLSAVTAIFPSLRAVRMTVTDALRMD